MGKIEILSIKLNGDRSVDYLNAQLRWEIVVDPNIMVAFYPYDFYPGIRKFSQFAKNLTKPLGTAYLYSYQ